MASHKDELKDHEVFYSCLGSRVGRGKDLFIKVDHQYPIDFATIAKDVGCKAYFLVSSGGAKANSWNLYLKTKGQVEDDLKEMGLSNLKILRPGLLLSRDNDSRIGEKIAAWIPFIPKISCEDVARGMLEYAYDIVSENVTKDPETLDNSKHP